MGMSLITSSIPMDMALGETHINVKLEACLFDFHDTILEATIGLGRISTKHILAIGRVERARMPNTVE